MSIVRNLKDIQANIKQAILKRSDIESSDQIKLIAVTKNQNITKICEAIAAGVTAIGENRVQEAMAKVEAIPKKVEKHLIGHLQTNKARVAVSMFDLIHSVDSEKLAVEINKAAAKINKCQEVLIQVNVSEEKTKYGVTIDQVIPLARFVSDLENIKLSGLMTIAPYYEDAERTRPIFRELFRLFCELRSLKIPNTAIEWLSMGMTNDYMVAIEEGSNMVRIGTGLFGVRNYSKEAEKYEIN